MMDESSQTSPCDKQTGTNTQPQTHLLASTATSHNLSGHPNHVLSVEDFAALFGITAGELSQDCRSLINSHDFRYRILEGEERDQILLDVLKRIEADTQEIGAPQRKGVFEKGWSENYQAFQQSQYDLDELVPKYIRPNSIVRLNLQYVMPESPTFELDYYSVFRHWLFKTYLHDMQSVYEFGCGTGWNLVALAQMYPTMEIHGLDFVPSSRDLVDKIGSVYGLNFTGHVFDMLAPDENISLKGRSAIFTVGALEQLAGDFEPFLQFLMKRSPALCITVEPTLELYDENNLVDYLAMKFHSKRGYTTGLFPRLKQLETLGKVEILHTNRSLIGNMLMDGYSLMVWRPKKDKH